MYYKNHGFVFGLFQGHNGISSKFSKIRLKIITLLLLLSLPIFIFSGCATTAGSATSASGLSSNGVTLSTKMSSSIFLQPVAPNDKIIYVSTRNTSTAIGLNFKQELISYLINEGYTITNNPEKANFMLMSNVLYVGKKTKSYTMAGALTGGFGGALIGSRYNSATGVIAGGLVGGLIGAAIGAAFKNKAYIMVVDIQLEQRRKGSYMTNGTSTSEGLGNSTTTYNAGVKNWAIYRDRIVSQAKAINLVFSTAEPLLKKQIAHSIANLMP